MCSPSYDFNIIKSYYSKANYKNNYEKISFSFFCYLFYVLQKGRCFYSGVYFNFDIPQLCPSVERLENQKEHTKENCRLVLIILNSICVNKGEYEEFQDWSVSKFNYARGIYLSSLNGGKTCTRPWSHYKRDFLSNNSQITTTTTN